MSEETLNPTPKRKVAPRDFAEFQLQPSASKEYNIVFVGFGKPISELQSHGCFGLFGADGPLSMDKTECALFVHVPFDGLHQAYSDILNKLPVKFDSKIIVWRVVHPKIRSRTSPYVGRPTATFVLLATTPAMATKVSHNNMMNEIEASIVESERMLLDMVANMFPHDHRLYVRPCTRAQIAPAASASASETAADPSSTKGSKTPHINRSQEFDLLCYTTDNVDASDTPVAPELRFVPHKPATVSTARNCRIFATWLYSAKLETLRGVQKPFMRLVDPKHNDGKPETTAQRLSDWREFFFFMPDPTDPNFYPMTQADGWLKRFTQRVRHLAEKKRPIVVVDESKQPEEPKPKRRRGFALPTVVTRELADFLKNKCPDVAITYNDQGQPMVARTTVVQAINIYLKNSKIMSGSVYELDRDPELLELLKPQHPHVPFLKLNALFNPHFYSSAGKQTAK